MALTRLDCTVSFGPPGTTTTVPSPSASSASAVGTVTPESSNNLFNYPNLPSGMVPIFNTTLDATGNQPTLSGFAGGMTDNSNNFGGSQAYESITTDATAPISPPNVMQVEYPAGWAPGTTPIAFYSYAPWQGTGYHRAYLAFAQLIPASFVPNASTVTKIFYLKPTQGANFFLSFSGAQGGPFTPRFQLQLPGPGNPNPAYPNVPPYNGTQSATGPGSVNYTITAGQWYVWEVLTVLNSPGSSANGTCDIWMTTGGVTTHTHSYTDLQISSLTDTWSEIDWEPYWGGNTAPNLATTCFTYMDNITAYAAT